MTDQNKYTNKLKDKNILVIGGSSGIGYGVAEALVEYGAHVTISSSSQSRVDSAVSKLTSAYPSAKARVVGYAFSLSDASTLEGNVVSLLDKSTESGKLDHIVYTAGDPLAIMPLSDLTVERMQQAGMVRFYAPLMIGKHASKYLNSGPASSITLTTGSVSQKPQPGWSGVGSFATALHGLTRGLALDLKPIRVNLVSPGAVSTELWSGMSEEQRAATFKHFEANSTTGAIGKIEDVAETFLAAIKDYNMTGTMLSTNSGVLLM